MIDPIIMWDPVVKFWIPMGKGWYFWERLEHLACSIILEFSISMNFSLDLTIRLNIDKKFTVTQMD